MNFEQFLDAIPEYAKDMRLNLSTLVKQAELTEEQVWGVVAACAIASRNATVTKVLLAEAAAHLAPEALHSAKCAAAVMGMNNVYYRFQHLMEGEKYKTIPARLRMQAIRMHGGDPVNFELYCTAVSAINNCQACLGSHEHVLREKGVTEETIVAAVRLASVIHSLAAVFDAEAALA